MGLAARQALGRSSWFGIAYEKNQLSGFQVKISKISIIEPQWNKHITRQYLLFMSGTCTLDVRYMFGKEADMYWTSTGYIADNDRRCIGATRGLLYG